MKKVSGANQIDNHRILLFVSMFLLSLVFLVKSSYHLLSEEFRSYLPIIGNVVFVLFLIVLVVLIFWRIKYVPKGKQYQLLSMGSFVNEKFDQACRTSWVLTFLLLLFVTNIKDGNDNLFPVRFYIDLTLFCMLAVFSVSFFYYFRLWEKESNI
ncbi:hypothetical protein H2O64_14820 [Kordia sp. YSTF-M3]|uniref:Uncharacterized protein n=1 Tax=Kordia aestuariivivens TaxID=2759037 RepID=A0ABR7QBN1_9FLAO|nr:hypothetical protein [Kordia aestuariivivens]MBC8755949.1 hypothetical protein [Kordia aestuariivivens]